jgi:hypothetical protein
MQYRRENTAMACNRYGVKRLPQSMKSRNGMKINQAESEEAMTGFISQQLLKLLWRQ